MRTLCRTFCALAAGLVPEPAAAHHSYAGFDRSRAVTIEGELQAVDWRNPHVLLTVKTGEGADYRIVWDSPERLAWRDLDESPFRPGDRLVLTGSPNLDLEERALTLMMRIERPADGWRWTNPSAYRRSELGWGPAD